jgi:hypothetical protein
MGRSFAQDLCASESGKLDGWQKLQRASAGSSRSDSLSRFSALPVSASSGSAEDVALANSYSILYSLGRAESSGFANEGEDMSAARGRKASAIESGLFQVSYDVMGADPVYRPLKDYYAGFKSRLSSELSSGGPAALAQACGGEDGQRPGLLWHKKLLGGATPSAKLQVAFSQGGVCSGGSGRDAECFQAMNAYCPPFAVHFNSAAIRINRRHWGPLNVRSIQPTCGAIFEKIVSYRAEVCGQLRLKPGDDPALNDD